jgi:two-component system, response regulator YesN
MGDTMKHLFKRGIFSKLFLNITLSVVMAILLTSIVLYSTFESMIMKYEYQARVEQINSKQAQVSKLSEVAVKIGNQIYHDMNVVKLLYSKVPNVNDMSAAFNQLRTYRATIPYIESIYIYNKYNNYVYVEGSSEYGELTQNGYERLNEGFLDETAGNIINNFKDYKPFKPIARSYVSQKNKKTKYFYTFFMYDSYTKNKETSGVLINFKTDYLLDASENKLRKDTEYFIVDEKGNIVSNGASLLMLQNYSDTSYIRKIISNGDKQGYFTDTVNEEKMFVVYSPRDQYGWQYVSLTRYDSMLSSVNWIQMLTIIVSFIFVIIGILLAFWITRRLYHPIYEMETDIKELEHEQRNAKNILKRVYISDLLGSSEANNKEYLKNYFRKLNMEMDFEKNLSLVLVRIDGYRGLIGRTDAEMLHAIKFSIINVFQEVLETEYIVHGTDMGESDVLFFINMEAEADHEKFAEKLQFAKEAVCGYFNISLTVVMSSFGRQPEQLMALYHQVTEAALHRVFYDKGSMIYADSLNKKPASGYEYPVSKEKQLVEALMAGKVNEGKEIYEVIFSDLRDYPISIFNMAIARLIVTLNNTVSVLKKNNVNSSFESQDMVLQLHQLESESDLKELFYSFFDKIQEEFEKKKAGKQDFFFEQIKNLIQVKYMDPDFSVESLANNLNKSVPYISRIYAQNSGTTIKDTISNLRMEMAKQLLANKNLSISEVTQRVGFSSTSYFHKAFKKANGVTPKEYQDKETR